LQRQFSIRERFVKSVSAIFLHSAFRQTQANLSNPRIYAVFGIVVLIFAISGPFGTYDTFSLPHRLGLWFLIHAATWTVAIFSLAIIDTILGANLPNKWVRLFIGGAIAAIPVAAITILAEYLLRGAAGTLNAGVWIAAFANAVPLTLAFSALSTLAAAPQNLPFVETTALQAPADPLETKHPALPAILARLPLAKRGELISLSASDHYVEVVTVNGTYLVLARLADAVAETAPTNGRMIHRSHWVANSGIVSLDGAIGNAKLRLTDGRTLPVSRAKTNEIRVFLAIRSQ
jgi:DNA-binding LytR/AlgR family response regulator